MNQQRPETFFVDRIRRGLALSNQGLSEAEERFLLMALEDIAERSPLTPDRAFQLHGRWLDALSRAYADDLRRALLAGPPRTQAGAWSQDLPGEDWRENLRRLSRTSEAAINGVAQDWYTRHGRAVEQHAITANGAVDSGFAVPPPISWS